MGLLAEAPDLLVAAKGIAGTGVEAEVGTQVSGSGEPGEAGPGNVEEEKALLAAGRMVLV